MPEIAESKFKPSYITFLAKILTISSVARIVHFLRQHLVGKTIKNATAIEDANVFGKVGTTGPEFAKAMKGKKVLTSNSPSFVHLLTGIGCLGWNSGEILLVCYYLLDPIVLLLTLQRLVMDKPPHPVMHFGMTGWIHIKGERTAYTNYYNKMKDDEKEMWPPKYWKFQLHTKEEPVVEIAFTDPRRFGRVRLVDCPGESIRKHSPLVENGPDPVVDTDVFTEDYLRKKMRSRHVPIKALLLDQAAISGIGNWVGDEVLFQAKLHPEQYCDDFSDEQITTLYKAIRYVCQLAVDKLGDSDQFPKDWLFHFRWGKGSKGATSHLPTGEKLAFLTVGGRTSCYAPEIQKKSGRVVPGVKEEIIESDQEEVKPKKGSKAKAAPKKTTASTEKVQTKKRKFKTEEDMDKSLDALENKVPENLPEKKAKKPKAEAKKPSARSNGVEKDEAKSSDAKAAEVSGRRRSARLQG